MNQRGVKILVGLIIAVAAVAVVVIKTRKTEFDKIEAAVPGWLGPNGCAYVNITRPSSDVGFVRWAGGTASTALISCEYLGGFLDYAKFPSAATLYQALHAREIPERLCVTGHTALMDGVTEEDGPSRFTKTCRTLHGILYPAAVGERIVDPVKVPAALRGTHVHVVYHDGPRPARFVSAIYGTASNSRGKEIHFGLFFVKNTNASRYSRPDLMRLVPGATEEGLAEGESYIEVTSAGNGSHPKSRGAREELQVAHELRRAVAGLAPRAFQGEGL